MNVVVYSEPSGSIPYLRVISPGLEDAEQAAQKFLEPLGINYAVVDKASIPLSPYFPTTQTVDITGPIPVFGWDLDSAKEWASKYNASYWQKQYELGILGLAISNEYQLQLAIATPVNDRTADQVAAVEFMIGVNDLQQAVQNNIDAATTAEGLITILDQLG